MSLDQFYKETIDHIDNVKSYIFRVIGLLVDRAKDHDKTKLKEPELSYFLEWTPKLGGSTYGSPEYQEFLKNLKPALDHHYAENPHHPEHHKNGIDGMNLVDLIEMIGDWVSASKRHVSGDPYKSIEINTKRFNLSPQLVNILKNTVKLLED